MSIRSPNNPDSSLIRVVEYWYALDPLVLIDQEFGIEGDGGTPQEEVPVAGVIEVVALVNEDGAPKPYVVGVLKLDVLYLKPPKGDWVLLLNGALMDGLVLVIELLNGGLMD